MALSPILPSFRGCIPKSTSPKNLEWESFPQVVASWHRAGTYILFLFHRMSVLSIRMVL